MVFKIKTQGFWGGIFLQIITYEAMGKLYNLFEPQVFKSPKCG